MIGVLTALVLLALSGLLVVRSARRLERSSQVISAIEPDRPAESARSLRVATDELATAVEIRDRG